MAAEDYFNEYTPPDYFDEGYYGDYIIHYIKIEASTKKALLFKTYDGNVWVPKSQATLYKEGTKLFVKVPEWMTLRFTKVKNE